MTHVCAAVGRVALRAPAVSSLERNGRPLPPRIHSVKVGGSRVVKQSRKIRSRLVLACAGGNGESASTDVQPPEPQATPELEQSVAAKPSEDDGWQPLIEIDSFPKGTRQKVTLNSGSTALLLWYRKKVYAVEPRSPAEAAFSEGFETAKLTQDGKIICPTTESTFDIKTGKLVDWYPGNVLLRTVEPKCRDMEVWPVAIHDNVVYAQASAGSLNNIQAQSPVTLGGSNTSAEKNNVYGIEPKMYINDPNEAFEEKERTTSELEGMNPATLVVAIVAVGIVGVAGTAVCLYYQSYIGLAIFWILGFGSVAVVGLRSSGALEDE